MHERVSDNEERRGQSERPSRMEDSGGGLGETPTPTNQQGADLNPPKETEEMDGHNHDHDAAVGLPTPSSLPPILDPPLSSGEKMRDALLRKLDGPCFQYLGIAVLVGVVGSGALFFFFLMGWQTLCRPRTDCQPRNDIYNFAIHMLNVLFTYMATVSMPWRCTNLLHTAGLSCPRRDNTPGRDLYGLVTDDVWFHVPLRQRMWVLVFLLVNCLTQYANQATRIVYYNYELQAEFPGNVWVNVFFAASAVSAPVGGCLMGYYTGQVRATDPQRFGQGPIELARDMWYKYVKKEAGSPPFADDDTPANVETGSGSPPTSLRSSVRRAHEISSEFDPTRSPTRKSVIDVNRSSMRMFAL